MARRRHVRVKLRNSLHGAPIAIPRNVSKGLAGEILRQEMQKETPVDEGNAISHYEVKTLANGDLRVANPTKYIRRLMIDGSSKQSARGAYNRAIKKARARILQEGLDNA